MARTGPVVMTVVNDEFPSPTRINVIIWEGATASGDVAVIRSRVDGDLLWAGRTDTTQTYIGANFGPSGIHAPKGFYLAQISAGRVLVYLREEA